MDAALRAAQFRYDHMEPPVDERAERINGWLESQACTDWIIDAVDQIVGGKDVVWSKSGRRNIGIFAHQLHEMVADECSPEWQAYCHACLIDRQQRTDDSKQTKEIAGSNLDKVMRQYAYQIVSDRAAEYAAHLIDKEAADASEWGV